MGAPSLPVPAPGRCSAVSSAVGEQLVGTAPSALGWVALEQDGPWGARAFTASHLDPSVGSRIETAATMAGVRAVLIRRPGRHADPHLRGSAAAPARAPGAPRHVLVAHSMPGRTWLLSGLLTEPSLLLDLDWRAVASGDLAAVRASLPGLSLADGAQLLVCTNGTRDVCCAVEGRPVVAAAASSHPGRVWETTHTSGHRFAPTAVLLPHGTLHGRLTAGAGQGSAAAVLDAADRGETVLAGFRGRSTWAAPGQVAEQAVRELTGELSLDALTVRPDSRGSGVSGHGEPWRVSHRDGRVWQVDVFSAESPDVVRPESCGKTALPLRRWSSSVSSRGA